MSIPQTIRRGQLYRNLVEATLRFLIEQVGQVKGVYPAGEKLSKDFLVRRAAGNGIELAGILAFRASPVWVLAALADASGAGRYLIREIAASLKDEGLLDRVSDFTTVDEMLDGLEASAGRMAATVNTPPLDITALRREWKALRQDLSKIPPRQLPSMDALRALWSGMKEEARKQNRTVFQVSSLMAMSAISNVPEKARWLSASARSAARKAGAAVAAVLLEDYRATLGHIRETGYARYAARQFSPYLSAVLLQFSPRQRSLTERLLTRKKRPAAKKKRRARLACVWLFITVLWAAVAVGEESGRLVQVGPIAPVAHPPNVHPMFNQWTYIPAGPIVCVFHGDPQTRYQVFLGLIEDYWDRAGRRLMDIQVAGKVLATVDAFNGSKGKPHGYLFPAITDQKGELWIRICPNASAPDKNPAICGLLLFPADARVEAEEVIANRGPQPLALALPGYIEPQFFQNRGQYFARKDYVPKPLPKFAEARSKLPSPIFDEDPACVELYWKAWELAFRNFHEPATNSGFVSQFIDAAFNQNIFLWDTCFMTMFCNYGHPYVPGICSLDNFYCRQFADGEICREIDRASGREYHEWINREGGGLLSRWGVLIDGGPRPFTVTYVERQPPEPPPHLTLDALNHPIFAWAELESFRVTGDRDRLKTIYEPLTRYYRALQKYLRQGNGLYMTDWASMDNSPRNRYLDRGGTAIDTSAEMALFARNLARIAGLLGQQKAAVGFRSDAEKLTRLINEKMWDPIRKFYFDLTLEGKRSPVKTVAAYWTLLAEVAGPEQVAALAAELHNPATFGRKHPVPTVPGDEQAFDPAGGYWNGAVWEPVNTMVIRGLEINGNRKLADEIALEHLRLVTQIFRDTGTVWENYAPDAIKPGTPAKRDFVGWSGLGPILYLIEYGIGIRVDAAANSVTWYLRSSQRVGIEKLWFGQTTASLVCEAPNAEGKRTVRVQTDGRFRLKLFYQGILRTTDIPAGEPVEIQLEPRR